MSNDKDELRFWKLHSRVGELVREGKRASQEVARVLQVVQDEEGFSSRFFSTQPKAVSSVSALPSFKEQLDFLAPLYSELFGFSFDPKKIRILEAPSEFNRIIVASSELRPSQIISGLRKRMKVELFETDLDKEVIQAPYIQRPKGAYAVLVRESEEADEDMRNRSAKDLEGEGVNCLTFEERLLYEAIYYTQTGKHLDIRSFTLCAGSRDRAGRVPCVRWRSGYAEVRVRWWYLGDRGERLRARLAVS